MTLSNQGRQVKIAISGAGFVANGVARALSRFKDVRLTATLSRNPSLRASTFVYPDLLTSEVDRALEGIDLLVECTGTVLHATSVVYRAMELNIPVVTLNCELHVTTGSSLGRLGILSESEGDQPGCLAAMASEAKRMGFSPLVYGNVKTFLQHDPLLSDMHRWSREMGISVQQTTSFTDGTKLNIEQVLVANGLGASMFEEGMRGEAASSVEEGAQSLGRMALSANQVISDYVQPKSPNAHMFVAATHEAAEQLPLRHLKLGEGPIYVLTRGHHLAYLEIEKTARQVLDERQVLLCNGPAPRYGVAAIAKRDLAVGEYIEHGVGSFTVRGISVDNHKESHYVPIGLIERAVVARPIRAGQILRTTDIALPDSLAQQLWLDSLHS